jgi:hypothetical protein
MSEDMTIDRDGMAAEYVLGTLDLEERRAAQVLLAEDAEFAAKVKQWERRLGELHLMVEPVEPEAHVWQRIKARLPEAPPKPEAKLEEAAIGAEPSLQPEISRESPYEPEKAVAESTREPEPAHEPEPEAEPQARPEIDGKPELEPNHDLARKTAAEVNFESAIAAVESALASHGAAAAAKSEAALAGQQVSAVESATASPPAGQADQRGPSASPALPASDLAVHGAASGGATDQQLRAATRQLTGWRALALVMSLTVVIMVGLVALWRFAPERIPPALQPSALMRLLGIDVGTAAPARKPAPPESQYDE